MEAQNNLPESFVISESKINTQTVDRLIKTVTNKDWATVWKKRNLNDSPSDVEKLPEVVAEVTNTNTNMDMSTLDYNKALCANDLTHLYEHTHVTVAFTNVSRNFIFSLRDMKGVITVSDLPPKDVVFWVPPCVMETPENAVEYGNILNDSVTRVDKLWQKVAKDSTDHEFKVKQAMDNLIPSCASTACVATCNINAWKEIAFRNTQFWSNDEARYTFLNLVRNLKMRYASVFFEVVVEDSNGQQYGMDTITSSPYAWKNVRLAKKREAPVATPPVAKPVAKK
jgi:hypothetical protein